MKKVFILIIGIVVLLAIGLTSGYQKTRSSFIVESTEQIVNIGEEATVTVKLNVDIDPGETVQGWIFNLCYNKEVLELVDTTQLWNCSQKGQNCIPEVFEVNENEGRVSYGDIVSYTGEGITSDSIYELLRLRFRGRSKGEGDTYFCDDVGDKLIDSILVIDGEERKLNNINGKISVE